MQDTQVMRWILTACALSLLLFTGCRGKAETPDELKASVLAASAAAQSAQCSGDYKGAEKAAKQAENAREKLRKLAAGAGEVSLQAKSVLVETDAATRRARYFAELAEEEHHLNEKLNGLAAKGYRATRAAAHITTFKGLALAADQAGKGQLNSLPQSVCDAAGRAASYAGSFAGRKPLADGSPDWPGISKDMDSLAANPPTEFAATYCAGYMLFGQWQLALYELDGIDPNRMISGLTITPDEYRLGAHIVRGLVYRANGFGHIAAREFTTGLAEASGKSELATDPQLMAMAHFLSALGFLQQGELKKGDLEMVEAMRADPNGPIARILTGERLAANGQYDEAIKTFETAMTPKNDEERWLAERINERAREIRDKKGEAEPLICDAGFLCRIAMHYLGESAAKSEQARRLKEYLDSSKSFCSQLTSHLPGVSQPSTTKPEKSSEP